MGRGNKMDWNIQWIGWEDRKRSGKLVPDEMAESLDVPWATVRLSKGLDAVEAVLSKLYRE